MTDGRYIAGYETVSKEIMKPLPGDPELALQILIETTIPIYTLKHPNPKSGQADCPITKREKERFRLLMKEKLEKAETEQERQKVIDHYKSKWSE